MPDAVVVADREGRMVFVNRRAESMTGYRRSQLLHRKVELLVPTRQRSTHAVHRRGFYDRGVARPMGAAGADLSLRRKDGSVIAVEISLGPAGHDTVAVIRDVTERNRMEAALEHQALHDPLTELANRTLFFDRLQQVINVARRDVSRFALVLLDLDGFKAINDAYGHGAGDKVLKRIGTRLAMGLRATDTAARIGGDEFAWIFPEVSNPAAVERIVRRRLAAARDLMTVDRHRIAVGISAGVAIYPFDGRDADTLINHADAAMYSAKREGRTVAFHLPSRKR
jgi:diguanylate cyclase (GGDEF)-like protein/PAS domain S-box-containing protein